jgi:hypothetical protein
LAPQTPRRHRPAASPGIVAAETAGSTSWTASRPGRPAGQPRRRRPADRAPAQRAAGVLISQGHEQDVLRLLDQVPEPGWIPVFLGGIVHTLELVVMAVACGKGGRKKGGRGRSSAQPGPERALRPAGASRRRAGRRPRPSLTACPHLQRIGEQQAPEGRQCSRLTNPRRWRTPSHWCFPMPRMLEPRRRDSHDGSYFRAVDDVGVTCLQRGGHVGKHPMRALRQPLTVGMCLIPSRPVRAATWSSATGRA